MDNSIIADKSKAFALRIIRLKKYLAAEKREYIMANQIVRSGTSIGSNIREARRAQSDADFIHKLCISLKEADETQYWLELLHESDYINDAIYLSMNKDCDEIIRILVSIIKTKRRSG